MTDIAMAELAELTGTDGTTVGPATHLVTKATPYTFTPSYLTATDPNPLPPSAQLLSQPRSDLETLLKATARDGAQSLVTQLLTDSSISIVSNPTGLSMTLPPSNPPLLPRRQQLPKPKTPTKWEAFAKKKGVGKYAGNAKGGAALEEKRKNLVYDEASGEWVKKWGYKGKNHRDGGEWLVELDDKQVRKEKDGASEGKTVRGEGKREKMERLRRQERKERNNARRGRPGGK